VVILLVAFALRVALASLLPNIHHPDEVFQYLEQGHRLAFGYGVVPWEFIEGARSWLLPGFLGALMWVTAWLGGGATAYLAVIHVVISVLSLSIVAVAFLWAKRLAGPTAAILAGVVTATWFELVYFGSKPLTEAVAAGALFWAAYLMCSCDRPSRRALFCGGALLGLTLVLRMHLAPAVVVVAIAACRLAFRQRWLPVAIGGASVVVAAGMLDWIT
jgi:GPI mannosyltransferase 3